MKSERYIYLEKEIEKIRGCETITPDEADELERALFQDRDEYDMFCDVLNGDCKLCECEYWIRKEDFNDDCDCCSECLENSESYQAIKRHHDKESYLMDRARDNYKDSL